MSARVQEIFEGAVGLQGPAREDYLDSACGPDAALRAEVLGLLRVHDQAPKFLASPTGGPPAIPGSQATTMVAPIREGPGTRIGPYKLLQLIGEGGFGSVFMAEQEKPVSRKVALKIIKLGMDTRAVIARFEAERQALALMDHPNIARVLDAGATETGRPFFVMELCKGDAIVEYCDKNSLSIQDRLGLFEQVCQAVQHAHTKGIIHRDIKPSNILVSTQDARPHAKVIDFGIAKATAAKLTEKTLFTEHRQLIGTPEYMSPEQAEGSLDIDTRTDVYSLGVLLYELLTGTTPFSSKELRSAAYAEIQRIIREVEPPKPSTRLSHNTDTIASVAAQRHTEPRKLGTIVRGELDWIVMKALEKDRTRRYETANGLAMDIRRYLAGEAVLAAPPSRSYRLRKFVRKNRASVTAASLVAAALVLGMAGTAWQAKVARDQATAAKAARDAEKTRADELKQVSDFQEKMLSQVDATAAGVRLTEDVNRRFAAALEKDKVPETERAGLSDEFRKGWARVNATDAAAALIDETILKPAVKAIDEQFKDQPVVDAQLRRAIGRQYSRLGLNDRASPLLASALATRRRVLGEEHPDTIISIANMSTLLRAQGKLADAESYAREWREKRRRQLEAENPGTLSSITNLGDFFSSQGEYAKAEPYRREALEKSRRELGEEHPSTITSIDNMGSVLGAQGKFVQAEPYLREALEKRRRVQGEEHPDTLAYISQMGYFFVTQKKYADAEPYIREVLEKSRRVFGEEHRRTIAAMMSMGLVLKGQGKLAEAEAYLRKAEALEISRANQDSGMLHYYLDSVGRILLSQGKFAEAESYFHERLENQRRVMGEEHPDTLISLNNIGLILKDHGRFAEAEPYLREALEKRRRVSGAEHPETLTCIHNMGALLLDQGKLAEAEACYREVLSVRRRTPGDARLSDAISALGRTLLKHGTLDAAREAEPLLRECLDIRIKATPDDWRVPTSRSSLGRAILALADLDPALTPEARAARLLEAEPLLLDGYAGLKDHPNVPSAALTGGDLRREALERIVHLYEVWDKAEPGKGYDAKAAEWKAKLAGSAPAAK